MIDIHSHIVFDVDDGPLTIADSINLIKKCNRDGVNTFISTSHFKKNEYETAEVDIYSHYSQLKNEVKKILPNVEIFYGGEIFYTEDVLDDIINGCLPTLNNTQYILIEFNSDSNWETIHSGITQLINNGFRPILANIEKYDCLSFEKAKLQILVEQGCYFQVNSTFVSKQFFWKKKSSIYNKRIKFLLQNDLVHFVASDIHTLKFSKPNMGKAYSYIEKNYGLQRAKMLFVENPKKLLGDFIIPKLSN